MKKTVKILLNEEIKKWKNEKSNKEILGSINPEFIDGYFKTMLINFPKDSTWIHNIGNDKFSTIATTKWSNLNSGPEKYDEIVSINLIDQQDDEELWNEDSDSSKQVDVLNIVIDCSRVFDVGELKQLISKYSQLGKWISTRNTYSIENNYGTDFLNNLKVVVNDNWNTIDKLLKVVVSFINIPDESINLKKIITENERKQAEKIDDTNFVSFYLYNYEELYNLFKQCQNCQWPYVNATESLELTSKDVCTYKVPGQNLKGYMCNISAQSIAELYHKYKNALFSGNIRYFIKKGKGAKQVNTGIKETIHNADKRGMFYFYNNGITIISPSVKLKGKNIELDKFSIVNGGQTTYILGTEKIDEDFTIPCKILEIKCDVSSALKLKNEEKYKENLSVWLRHAGDISYALNSQKPVAAKDLITNKLSVRNLKHYYNSSSGREVIFLTKAGEESFMASEQKEKFVKLESYLSLVHCFFFQMPGFAKNQKSKMYQKENIKRVIGQDDDTDCKKMFSPLQLSQTNIAKKQIDKIVNKIGRNLKKNPDLYNEKESAQIAVLKHCKNIILSLFGLAYMTTLNDDLFDQNLNSKFFFNEFNKKYSRFIDLDVPIFNQESLINSSIWEDAIKKICNYIIFPAYEKWAEYKKSQNAIDITGRLFSINDDVYFGYVVETFKRLYKNDNKQWKRIFIDLLNLG